MQTHPSDALRPPIDTQEAIRLIVLKLRVTKIVPPGEDDGQALPVVHFKGSSRSMHASWDPNANSTLRGMLFTLFPKNTRVASVFTYRCNKQGQSGSRPKEKFAGRHSPSSTGEFSSVFTWPLWQHTVYNSCATETNDGAAKAYKSAVRAPHAGSSAHGSTSKSLSFAQTQDLISKVCC